MKLIFIFLSLFLVNFVWAAEVSVKVLRTLGSNFYIKTSEVEGSAKKSGDKITADNIVVNMKSLKTDVPLLQDHIQKKLETDKYPTAVLIHGEGSGGKGTGKIRIHGIEKDFSGVYEVSGANVKVQFDLKISDFKIKDVRYLGVGAKDDIKLEVTIPIAASTK